MVWLPPTCPPCCMIIMPLVVAWLAPTTSASFLRAGVGDSVGLEGGGRLVPPARAPGMEFVVEPLSVASRAGRMHGKAQCVLRRSCPCVHVCNARCHVCIVAKGRVGGLAGAVLWSLGSGQVGRGKALPPHSLPVQEPLQETPTVGEGCNARCTRMLCMPCKCDVAIAC
jgi:hypothetical protein